MNRERIGDVVLGVTMVLLGTVPAGLVATGRAELLVAGDTFIPPPLGTVLVAFFTLCGLVLAAAGVNVLRHGRSDSDSGSLY